MNTILSLVVKYSSVFFVNFEAYPGFVGREHELLPVNTDSPHNRINDFLPGAYVPHIIYVLLKSVRLTKN